MKDFKSVEDYASIYNGSEVLSVKYISHNNYESIRHFDYVIASKVDYVSTWEEGWKDKYYNYLNSGLIGRGHGGPGMPDSYSIYNPLAWIIEDKNK